MYYLDFLYIKSFIFKINYFLYIKDFFFINKNIILNVKSFSNIFLFLSIFTFIFFFFLKKKKNDFYKKNKIYKSLILNIIFFIFIFYLLNFENNFILLLKSIYIKLGNNQQSIFLIFITVVWFFLTAILSIYNINIIDNLFIDLDDFDLSFKLIICKILSAGIFFFFISLGVILINFDKFILGLIGGSLSLSISMSLQKIFSNYLSGFLILFDKTFKLGDAVSLGGFQGVITQISSRYIMLRNLDCSEILIPNEKFLTEIIQNQSLFFSKGNLRISLQISHNNNINSVLYILIKATNGIERVLENPPVISYFSNFIINGIELELSFWISDAIRGAALVRSEVNIKIWNMLKLNNIELAYSKKVYKIIN